MNGPWSVYYNTGHHICIMHTWITVHCMPNYNMGYAHSCPVPVISCLIGPFALRSPRCHLGPGGIRPQAAGYGQTWPGGHFNNAYELLTLRALKISMFHKRFIFQCMGKIFCVEFQRYPLKFHTIYLTHTLKDMTFIQHWNFKSS